jgi:glucan biosynthesis protein C
MINKLKKERLYYLDALRSFLILLVALMHSSQVYNSSQTWLIYSENNSIIINYLVSLLGLLCMPTFFMIAGYFAVISFRHSHGKNFLLKRISRLLIPLVFIAFTLNILQAYILTSSGWKDYTISTYFSNGDWIQHLWFLINLIAYTLTAYLFIKYFKIQTKRFLLYISDKIESMNLYILLLILPLISIGLIVVKHITPSYFLSININQIISYTPYFLFGILLMLNKELLNKFTNISISTSIVVILLASILIKNLNGMEAIEYKFAYYYTRSLGTWFMASLAFTIFKKYVNYKSNTIYKISDASYSIYLLHHIIVIIIGIFIINLDLSIWIGISILFISSVTISYIVHRKLILNSNILQHLINGQKK